jgi:hypothetical protein
VRSREGAATPHSIKIQKSQDQSLYDSRGLTGTTARYVKASLEEVATALAALTGEAHPLALSEDELG